MRSVVFLAATILLVAACSSDTSDTTSSEPATSVAEATTTTTQSPTTTVAEVTTTVQETTTVPETTTTQPGVVQVSISYEGGEVTGGGRIEVPLGEPVELTIVSDVADEGHLHGYDLFVDLEPGTPGSIEFTADIPGIFELELEGSGVLLADFEVAP